MSSIKLKQAMTMTLPQPSKTHLSVNLNKVALLRNQRDVGYPDLIQTARIVLEAGAHGITVHPRPDQRHIRFSDIADLSAFIQQWPDKSVEFNIEGYPDQDFLELVTKYPCHQVTLVPDDPNQRTSDHGWDIKTHQQVLKNAIDFLHNHKRRVSLFVDPVPELIQYVDLIKADRIELYTGPYAEQTLSINSYLETALAAKNYNIGVNAGHDLTLDNLTPFIKAIPFCTEVSIGHAITSDALLMGWPNAVRAYLKAINAAHIQ